VLGLPQDKVHGIWVPGPGSYGRNDAGDAGIDAALLSKAVGRPVRVQGMRFEGHGWDPKGPASIHRARAALDKDGAAIGYVFESKGFSRVDIDTNESDPVYSLAGQLMGMPLKPLQGFGVAAESYGFANKQLAWETVAALLDRASPLRIAHLRDPVGCRSLRAKRSNLMPTEIASSPSAPRNSPSVCAIGRRSPTSPSSRPPAGSRAPRQPQPQWRHPSRARHRRCPALGGGGRNRRRGRDQPAYRQSVGAEIHRRP
jgi:hypothetical protein